MIVFLLEKYSANGSLGKEVCAMIHENDLRRWCAKSVYEEVKSTMAVKIQTLIQSAYLNDDL